MVFLRLAAGFVRERIVSFPVSRPCLYRQGLRSRCLQGCIDAHQVGYDYRADDKLPDEIHVRPGRSADVAELMGYISSFGSRLREAAAAQAASKPAAGGTAATPGIPRASLRDPQRPARPTLALLPRRRSLFLPHVGGPHLRGAPMGLLAILALGYILLTDTMV